MINLADNFKVEKHKTDKSLIIFTDEDGIRYEITESSFDQYLNDRYGDLRVGLVKSKLGI